MGGAHSNFRRTIANNLGFSISAHNVQPFQIRWSEGDSVEIWVEPSRLLPVADPRGKDLWMSCGALYETLRLACAAQGMALVPNKLLTNLEPSLSSRDPFFLARFTLNGSRSATQEELDLVAQLPRRFSYRGNFSKGCEDLPIEKRIGDLTLRLKTDQPTKRKVARIYDKVNLQFLSLPGYVAELASWLRLTPSHPLWAIDGLNSESMALSSLEAWGARLIFKPAVFHSLLKLRLAGPLMSEAPKIEGAAAVVALSGPRQGPFEAGREMLRGWLKLTSMKLFGAPLSLLTDDSAARQEVARLFEVPMGEEVYNVFRVGRLSPRYRRPASARRPKHEIIDPENADQEAIP